MKAILVTATAALIMATPLFVAPHGATAQTAPHPGRVVTLRIEGMEGEACPVLVERAVIRLDGVTHVDASLASHSATIEYDEKRISLADIRRAIKQQAGFDSNPHEMTQASLGRRQGTFLRGTANPPPR